MLTWAIIFFLTFFFVFFMFTIFGIPDMERRKKKEESSHRPATRIFVVIVLIEHLRFPVASLLED